TPPPPTSTLFPYTTLFRSRNPRARSRGAAERRKPLTHATMFQRVSLGILYPGACPFPILSSLPVFRPIPPDETAPAGAPPGGRRSEEHTSELQSLRHLVCR